MTQRASKIILMIGAIIIAALAVMGIIGGIQSFAKAITSASWNSIPGSIRAVGTNIVYLLAAISALIVVFRFKETWFTVAKVFAVILVIFVTADLVAMFIYMFKATISLDFQGIAIMIVSPSLMLVAGILYCIGVFSLRKAKIEAAKRKRKSK